MCTCGYAYIFITTPLSVVIHLFDRYVTFRPMQVIFYSCLYVIKINEQLKFHRYIELYTLSFFLKKSCIDRCWIYSRTYWSDYSTKSELLKSKEFYLSLSGKLKELRLFTALYFLVLLFMTLFDRWAREYNHERTGSQCEIRSVSGGREQRTVTVGKRNKSEISHSLLWLILMN